jgi:hypothetical protein
LLLQNAQALEAGITSFWDAVYILDRGEILNFKYTNLVLALVPISATYEGNTMPESTGQLPNWEHQNFDTFF